jgi:hypothetical protein
MGTLVMSRLRETLMRGTCGTAAPRLPVEAKLDSLAATTGRHRA